MGASQHGGACSGGGEKRHRLEDFEDEEMEALQSPRPPPLRTVISAEIRALASSDDGDAIQNVIMLGLLLIAAVSRCRLHLHPHLVRPAPLALEPPRAQVIVIGRMVYRDFHHDWKDCGADEQLEKHFYCVNVSQVHNVLAVAKKPFKLKDD